MTPRKLEYWPRLVAIARQLDLPQVEDSTAYGQPCLKAHKKLWVWCSPHADGFVFKLPVEERDLLIDVRPNTFFVTDHYRGHDLILVHPDALDAAWARSNLTRVWRAQAGKRFLQQFDANRA